VDWVVKFVCGTRTSRIVVFGVKRKEVEESREGWEVRWLPTPRKGLSELFG